MSMALFVIQVGFLGENRNVAKVTLTQDVVNDFRGFAAKFNMTVHELYNYGRNSKVMENEAVSRGFDSPHFVAPVKNADGSTGNLPGVHAFAGTTLEVPNDNVPDDMRDHPLVDMSEDPEPAFNPQQGSNMTAENDALKARVKELEAQFQPEGSRTASKPPKADSKGS